MKTNLSSSRLQLPLAAAAGGRVIEKREREGKSLQYSLRPDQANKPPFFTNCNYKCSIKSQGNPKISVSSEV